MATAQYIGARYVPVFADPIEWSSTKTYEPLTIVLHEGNSYTSKQFVPIGVDIANDKYWALTGNYNGQIEQYRRETAQAVAQVNEWLTDAQNKYSAKPFAFDTVADMQDYDALYAGAICHTNGFYTRGDGGAAYYVVSARGTANNMDILACAGGLFATLIVTETYVTPEQFGAYGDGTHDDSAAINRALSIYNNVKLLDKTYFTLESILINSGNVFSGTPKSTILNGINFGYNKTIIVGGDIKGNLIPSASSPVSRPRNKVVSISGNNITFASPVDYNIGDAVIIFTVDSSNYPINVDFGIVKYISTNVVTLDEAITNEGLFTAIASDTSVYGVDVTTPIVDDELDYYDVSKLVHDVHIHDITLEMKYPESGSGMFAIAACGYNWNINNITFKNVTTFMGSNMLCRSNIANCNITHTGGLADFAELCIKCIFENITFKRIGKNDNHYTEGFSCHGYSVYLRNINVDNAPYFGGFRMQYCSSAVFENCVFDSGDYIAPNANNRAFYFATTNSGFLKSTMKDCIIKCGAVGIFGFVDAYNCTYIGKDDRYALLGDLEPTIKNCITNGYRLSMLNDATADESNGICNVWYTNGIQIVRNPMGVVTRYIHPTYEINCEQSIEFAVSVTCTVSIVLGGVELTNISANENTPIKVYLSFVHSSTREYCSCIVINNDVVTAIYNKILTDVTFTQSVPLQLIPSVANGYLWLFNQCGYIAK